MPVRTDPEPRTRRAWDEADRMAALQRLDVLDTRREPLFDDIVALAAELCETPMAAISFVAEDGQRPKAEIGIGGRELPFDIPVPGPAELRSGLQVIPDLAGDRRHAGDASATGAGVLRFFAGAPIQTADGLVLGTVSVLDRAPRPQGLSDR